MNKLAKYALFVGVGAASLVAGSLTGVALATAIQPPVAAVAPDYGSVHAVAEFPTNDLGQTYGYVDQGLIGDPSARAQLVAATTDEGKDGWAYTDELLPAINAKTPAEAEKFNTDEPYKVAIYELDGKTLIGFQTVNRPAP